MTKIEYSGSVVATVEGGNTATLPIKDLKMKSDIKITVPEAETVEEYDGAIVIEEGESLISFTIEGVSFQAEDGMTWGAWVESEYNTDGCEVNIDPDGTRISHSADGKAVTYGVTADTKLISATDIIEVHNYYLNYIGSGSN